MALRDIPTQLKDFFCRDKNGEYIRLQDSNGYFIQIRLNGNNVTIINETDETRSVLLNNQVFPPKVHYDARKWTGVLSYHLRRNTIPGEMVVIKTDAVANIFQVIQDNTFFSWTYADVSSIGAPETCQAPLDVENNTARVEFLSAYGIGKQLAWEVVTPYDQSWLINKSGLVFITADGFYTGQEGEDAGFSITFKLDGETIPTFPDQYDENTDRGPYTFRIAVWDVESPDIKIYCDVCPTIPAP